MTLEALTQLTARLLGYDGAEDLDEAPRELIAEYINQAAAQAASQRFTPVTTDTVTLDALGTAPVSALSQQPVQLWQVTVKGAPRRYLHLGQATAQPFIHVPGCGGLEARITYGYLPPPLSAGDEPTLPAWFHSHLADYAAARMLGQGDGAGQDRARFFLELWYGALARLQGAEHREWRFRNVYMR